MKKHLKITVLNSVLNLLLLLIFSFGHFSVKGSVPLHEWTSSTEESNSTINEKGETEHRTPENLTTWIFEDGTFIPMAKLQGFKSYSIITDHLGTPVESYDEDGKKVWSRELGIYGQTRKEFGEENFIPFLYQGQYLDRETELAYNRYRYYSPESGTYVSQDPLRLIGNDNFYSYVFDSNAQLDPFGLIIVYRALNGGQEASALAGEAIQPKNVDATYTMQQHIDDGRLETQYISTTKKKGTARFYAKPNPKRGKVNPSTIIAIDTDKIHPSKVFDMSSGVDPQTGKNLELPAYRYATKDAEVLIEGEIPKGAYKICK